MKIHVDKIKVTVLSWKRDEKVRNYIDDKKVKTVSKLKYLGSSIIDDGRCEVDKKAMIPMVWEIFSRKKEIA